MPVLQQDGPESTRSMRRRRRSRIALAIGQIHPRGMFPRLRHRRWRQQPSHVHGDVGEDGRRRPVPVEEGELGVGGRPRGRRCHRADLLAGHVRRYCDLRGRGHGEPPEEPGAVDGVQRLRSVAGDLRGELPEDFRGRGSQQLLRGEGSLPATVGHAHVYQRPHRPRLLPSAEGQEEDLAAQPRTLCRAVCGPSRQDQEPPLRVCCPPEGCAEGRADAPHERIPDGRQRERDPGGDRKAHPGPRRAPVANRPPEILQRGFRGVRRDAAVSEHKGRHEGRRAEAKLQAGVQECLADSRLRVLPKVQVAWKALPAWAGGSLEDPPPASSNAGGRSSAGRDCRIDKHTGKVLKGDPGGA
mmetsp:Transcript_1049/g.2340  ORF Transcript_1049/g.2340 Transcript_1049/m.2340 type:complete len:356 (+) Transcript_1049:490-1557(+)